MSAIASANEPVGDARERREGDATRHGEIVDRGSASLPPRTRTRPRRGARKRGRRGRGRRGTSARRARSRRRRRRRSGSRAAGRGAAGSARGPGPPPPWRRSASRPRRCRCRRGAIASSVLPSIAVEEQAERGDRDELRQAEEGEHREALAAQIALRSDGASTSASKTPCSRSGTNARVSPSSAVKTIAVQSRPSETCGLASAGTAKWKIVSAERTKSSIAGTVSFARSSISRSLRASARDVARRYLMRTPAAGSRAARPGRDRAWRRSKARVRVQLVERRVEQRRAGVVERVERLVQDHQLGLVEEHAAEPQPLAHPTGEGRDPLVAHLPEPEALEQHPDPLGPLGDRGRAGRTGAGSRAGSARGRRAARGRGSRSRRGRAARARPPLGASRPGEHAEERRLARAVRPGDEQEPARVELDVDLGRTPASARSARVRRHLAVLLGAGRRRPAHATSKPRPHGAPSATAQGRPRGRKRRTRR